MNEPNPSLGHAAFYPYNKLPLPVSANRDHKLDNKIAELNARLSRQALLLAESKAALDKANLAPSLSNQIGEVLNQIAAHLLRP